MKFLNVKCGEASGKPPEELHTQLKSVSFEASSPKLNVVNISPTPDDLTAAGQQTLASPRTLKGRKKLNPKLKQTK